MKLQYRAIEGTNTKTRRIAYFTAILLTLRQSGLSEQVLLNKVIAWSQIHRVDLYNYYVRTGEITSTKQNSAGMHYLEAAANLKLIVSLAGVYRTSRVGSVLVALLETYQLNPNPFFLTSVEKLFYIYCLLKADADILLTIVDCILERGGGSLINLQRTFQSSFLERIDKKTFVTQDEGVRYTLRDRKTKVKEDWKKPERYAEHIVPPRLNWLLDLGFLKEALFRQHHFELTEEGQQFFSALPCLGECSLHDITDQWLDLEYWQIVAQRLLEIESLVQWAKIDSETQYSFMTTLLTEAFHVFRYSLVPRISLIQIMLYLSIRLLLDHHIIAGPAVLTEWFLPIRFMDGRRYEVRLSPRENESYLIIL